MVVIASEQSERGNLVICEEIAHRTARGASVAAENANRNDEMFIISTLGTPKISNRS